MSKSPKTNLTAKLPTAVSVSDKTPPRVVEEEWLSRSRLFHVQRQELEFSNGVQRSYERLNPGHDRAVIIAAMPDPDTILITREYGAGLGKYYLSLPKGAMDAGEDPEQTAHRELQEEAGFGARKLSVLKQIALSPSYMGNQITLVLAEDLYPSRLPGDEPEELDIIACPVAAIDALVANADFCEAYAIAALYMIKAHIEQR